MEADGKEIVLERHIGFIGCSSPTDILVLNVNTILEDEQYKFACVHAHPIWVINGPFIRFVREDQVVRKTSVEELSAHPS